MLPNNGEKHLQCPCCKACSDCSDLKKTVKGQGAGLVFYQQTQQTQLSKNIEPVKTTTTDDIFVLQHAKDKKFDMFGHVSTQELQNIECPRCKYIIEHAEKRLQTTGYIDKNSVIGVCDHCRKKNNLQIPCNECEDIVKKFITSSNEKKSDNLEQKRRTWLAKVKHFHKDSSIDAGISDTKIESSAHLQLHPSKLQGTKNKDRAFSKVEDPKIKIRPIPINKVEANEFNISKANIKKVCRTRSLDSYLQRLENASNLTISLKSGKRYGSKPDRIMSPVKRDYDAYSSDTKYTRKPDQKKILDTQHFDTYHLPDKKYISKSDRPTLRGVRDHDPFYQSDEKYLTKGDVRKLLDTGYYDIHYREGKKYIPEPGSRAVTDVNEYTSHDQRHGKQFVMPFDEDKSLQQIYSKGRPLDTKKPINIGEEKDKKKQASKSVKLTLGDTSVLTGSIYRARSETSMLDLKQVSVPKGIFKSATELYGERKPNIDFMKSDHYIEHYVSSTLPRQKTGKEKINTDMTSVYSSPNKKYTSEEALSTQSEIILRKDFSYQFPKEIIPKKEIKRLRTSAELIQETQDMLNVREEEKKQKIEIERTRKLFEQEIKNKAREEKMRLQEEKRKEEEEKKRKAKEEKMKIEEENRRLEEERRKEEEKQKNKKEDDRVKAKEKTKTELSKKEKIKPEENKEKAKEERKNALDEKRREKEESREKAKSEKVDKEADKLKKQKEKEIQLRMQKEEKQREKDEKERLKKEKEEQLRAEKARLQGEKEEEQKNKQTNTKKGESYDEKKSMPESKQPNIETPEDKQKEKDGATAGDFKKIRDEFNSKDEALKRKKEAQLEKSARDEADRKEKEIEKQAKIHGKEAKAVVKPEPVKETTKNDKKNETPIIKELDIKQIKVRKPSYDDLILRLVKLKQSEPRERVKQKPLDALDVPVVAREHKKHKYTKASKCIMCIDSEFELDVESILIKTDQPDETIKDIIIGQKIFKYKPPLIGNEDKTIIMPSLFQSTFQAESAIVVKKEPEIVVKEEPELKPVISVPKSQKLAEQDPPKGIIRYALSDRTFIEKGWTMLPTEKVVRKMNVYRMRPAHPEFDWFEHNKKKKLMLYDTGEKLADFDDKGRSRLYYRNGRLALDYYDAEEINAQQRFVVFSSGELDERGRSYPITILATFDYLGNGIVFDHGGKIRLKYNQTEGVVLDRGVGPVSHWKWHTLNDPPVLQKVMIDTQMAHKDPDIFKMGGSSDDKSRADNEEMLAIEFDNFIKEKSKKLTQTFKPFQIKMKALKINDNFSLKILDQATIYLIFRDGTTNVKLNLGMILDHKEIVDTDTAEVGEVSNNLERFPARTESLAGLQRSVAYAQRFERARMERERRLRPPEPCTSADQLTAASTRPLRPPLRTAPSSCTTNANSCKCSRKPCSSNVYYDTRLI